MQKWEYLEVIHLSDRTMADSTGRLWRPNQVRVTVGVKKGWRGEEAIQQQWQWASSGSALVDLGAEGWELVGVVPDGVNVQYTTNVNVWADLLIFKRPKQ